MKRTLCILLSLMLTLTGLVGLCVTASAKNYNVGDIIEFGSYPQSEVKDSATVMALNAAPGLWQSYRYYIGTDGYDGQMTESDFMQYRDVMCNGQMYRGVRFSKFRPGWTTVPSTAQASAQDENGYLTGKVYWFLYEPLKWRVLDPGTGLVLCESLIDSQPFHNYHLSSGQDYYGHSAVWGAAYNGYYANNYQRSDIRKWLNSDFEDLAFSAEQKNAIKVTKLDNRAYNPEHDHYDSSMTNDRVFVLSYQDMQNTAYGFQADRNAEDPARLAKGTDYAKCQGLSANAWQGGYSSWLLRTAGLWTYAICTVTHQGTVIYHEGTTDRTFYGVRPAITLDLTKYALLNAQLNVPQAATVEYKSTVTVTATADNIPTNYFVALYDGDTQLAKGDNKTVSYTVTKIKAGKTLTAKIIDVNGNVQSNADGKLEKDITITVKTGFFAKLKAFFLGLFGLLPKVTLNP